MTPIASLVPFASPALPGTWKLGTGRAITLRPAQRGVLRIAHGRVWVTFDGPHEGPLNGLGDRVLEPGDRLGLEAGQRVVVESLHKPHPAFFTWDPVFATATAPAARLADALQPLADLRAAVVLAGSALGRLTTGLARVAWELVVPPRPAMQSPCCP